LRQDRLQLDDGASLINDVNDRNGLNHKVVALLQLLLFSRRANVVIVVVGGVQTTVVVAGLKE